MVSDRGQTTEAARQGAVRASSILNGTVEEARVATERRRHRLRQILLPLLLLVVILVLWQFLPPALGVKPFIIPRFSSVISQFSSHYVLKNLWMNGVVTVEEALIGLGIGAGSGVALGLLLGESATLRVTLYPYVVAFQSLPKVAIAPLFVIWFGFGLTPKVLVAATLAFFPLLVNTMSGVMSVDRDLVDLFQAICASRRQTWQRLLLPAALPSIFAGMELATVLALLGAIIGEFVSAQRGLGILLQQQETAYDTAGVFATLVVLAALGVALNQIVVQLRKRIVFW